MLDEPGEKQQYRCLSVSLLAFPGFFPPQFTSITTISNHHTSNQNVNASQTGCSKCSSESHVSQRPLVDDQNPLISDLLSLHFPTCLNAAGRVTLRFKRLSHSGDGDCSSLKDRHRLKLFFFLLKRHVWLSFNEHDSFSPSV